MNSAPSGLEDLDDADAPHSFARVVYVQNWENARHLRNVRVLTANTFALLIAACLAALQLVRTDPVVEATLLGLLVVVAVIQLLISIELKRELDDCMAAIARQVAATPWLQHVGMLPHADRSDWLHLRWLYPLFYSATIVALAVAFASRLLT